MKATYKKPTVRKFTTSHRKERGDYRFHSYVVIDLAAPLCSYRTHRSTVDRITLRLYSTNARTTACVWVSGEGSGSGSAGGYGYHRESAAAQEALEAAGFIFDKDFRGVGHAAIEEALLACAAALGDADPELKVNEPAICESHP
jgi:hypothetical protein